MTTPRILMTGAGSATSGRVSVAHFTHGDLGERERFDLITIWRMSAEEAARVNAGFDDAFDMALVPLTGDALAKAHERLKRRLELERPHQPDDGWNAQSCGDVCVVELHRERRVARVMGAEYPLPGDEFTLLLLIDNAQTPPVVTAHAVPVAYCTSRNTETPDTTNDVRTIIDSDQRAREFLRDSARSYGIWGSAG